MRLLTLGFLTLALVFSVKGHVGSPYILFEGRAGSLPVRITVREPDVVPGLAEITVRVLKGEASAVTVLPLVDGADRARSPRPDTAHPTPGDPMLFSAALWFMNRGAYAVEVTVEGSQGGRVLVPVNSLASREKPMKSYLKWILCVLGTFLVFGWVSIIASAASQSRLPQGVTPRATPSIRSILGAVTASVIIGLLLRGGSNWWAFEAQVHQQRVVFHPLIHTVTVQTNESGARIRLSITDPRSTDDWAKLIPDHGKLVHLFLTAESAPEHASPAFAHLHPLLTTPGNYETALPPLPSGQYRSYADITHESGLTETLTNSVWIDETVSHLISWKPTDNDDSYWNTQSLESSVPVGTEMFLTLTETKAIAGEPAYLHARLTDSSGNAVPLEPFLRMLGHAVVERGDGQVFAHVHPAGTLSMAAARRLAVAANGADGGRASDANCGDLAAVPAEVVESLSRGGEVEFPYVFPEPGNYRIWIQVRARGQIRTAAFARTVAERPKSFLAGLP